MPSAPHSHFWPDGGVGGAAQLDHVDGDRAGALGAVEDHRHAGVGERGGRELAGAPVHVRAGDERWCAGRPRRRARANGTARISAPRSRAAISGPIRPGCSVVGGDDLVARADVHPREHLADSLARRGGERDLVDARSRAAPRSPPAARPAARSGARSERSSRPVLDLRRELARDGLLRRPRHRPVGARVEVRDALEDRELRAQRGRGPRPRRIGTERPVAALRDPGRVQAPLLQSRNTFRAVAYSQREQVQRAAARFPPSSGSSAPADGPGRAPVRA